MLEIKFKLTDPLEEEIIKCIIDRDGLDDTPEGYGEAFITMLEEAGNYTVDERYLDNIIEIAKEFNLDIDTLLMDE